MRITLHDNLHPSAGGRPGAKRPPIDDAGRAPWVKAMHAWLERVPAQGGAFAADLDVGTLRMRVRRHGTALSAVWSVGPSEQVVASSVLLPGEARDDDEAAVAALRSRVPPPPFDDGDYAVLVAEPRPCIGTLYLDARWHENARVELAATALGVAALLGPTGRLSVQDEPKPAPPLPPAPAELVRRDSLMFNFTRDRLQLVMDMVTKKGCAAIDQMPGVHFRVYPPPQFLERPGALRQVNIFDRLEDTSWCVRWYDNRCDRLSFGEFLGFIDQLVQVENAFAAATGTIKPNPPVEQNKSVWGERPRTSATERRPIKVARTLKTRELVEDANIRRLFAAVALEPATLPPDGH